jgi:O-antigen/teichoic acid export membrane protein
VNDGLTSEERSRREHRASEGSGDAPSSELHERGAVSGWARAIAGGSALALGANVLGNIGFFIAVLLLARGLAPSERGTVAFITVTAMVLTRLVNLGVPQATTVFAAQRPESRAKLLSNVMLVCTAGALVGSAFVCGGLLLLGNHAPAGIGGTELVILAAGALAASLVHGGSAFLLGCSRFRQRAVALTAWPWAYALLLLVVSVGPGLTITRSVLVWAIADGLGAALVIRASLRGIGLGRLGVPLLRESVSFGVRAWVGSLADFLNFRMDQLLMGFLATEAALGIYAVAVNASEVLILLSSALATTVLPVIAGSKADMRAERLLRVFRSLVIVTVPSIGLAALLGPFLVPAVFGGAYEESVLPFLLLLPGALGFAAFALFSSALTASGFPGLGSVGSAVSLIVGLGLDLALIPAYGATGAAVAASSAFLAGGLAAIIAYRSRTSFALTELVPRTSDLAALRALTGHAVRRATTAVRAER